MCFNEHFLRGVVPAASFIANAFPEDARFSVDTRTLQPGDLFVALKGERVDGHDFLANALKAGAAGLIIDADKEALLKKCDAHLLKNKLIVTVPDTLDALCRLAAAWRQQFTMPVVAITGSVGKTTTKELVAEIVRAQGKKCLVSHANQNTKIGAALNLLLMRPEHDCAVFEVGINERGEMKEIADIVRPTMGCITYIGHSHMEGLGSLAGVAAEKRSLFHYFSPDNIGVINGDQQLLTAVSYPHPIVKFGLKSTNQIQARKVAIEDDHISCIIKLYQQKFPMTFEHMHTGMLNNALAAASIAYLLGVPSSIIIDTIKKPMIVDGRFEQRALKKYKGTLINDAYNANPESMKAALLTFSRLITPAKKIVVVGDMLELGQNSPFWHRQLGRILRKMSANHEIVLVGSLVQWTKKALPVGAKVDAVATWQEVIPVLESKLQKNPESMILVKASHGVGLQKVADALAEPTKRVLHEQTA
jgi:UDP-N-acetylmuramoyl-tripeptide--D-alanyl-D-alanine ligase